MWMSRRGRSRSFWKKSRTSKGRMDKRNSKRSSKENSKENSKELSKYMEERK